MTQWNQFELSTVLKGHTEDVRAVCAGFENRIITGSRDGTVRLWKLSGDGVSYECESIITWHSAAVSCVAFIPPTETFPEGLIVSGGQDCLVCVGPGINCDSPLFTLVGHESNVSSVTANNNIIVSTSWDHTVRVWSNYECIHVLRDHSMVVWTACILSNDLILTGSADRKIKLWQNGKCIRNFEGHTDVIRSIKCLSNSRFISSANDSTIRLWSLDEDFHQVLSSHTSFVYAIDIFAGGEIVSCGEDRSIRLWQDGECSQVIFMPTSTIWSVAVLPNGDFAAGSADGLCRVFSKDPCRYAPKEMLDAFQLAVKSYAIPKSELSEMKYLSSHDDLKIPGKKNGEVKMIKTNDVVEAYQWDNNYQKWEKIGTVVDAVNDTGREKPVYEGQQYDFVFDIDYDEGKPPAKLPFNVTENPWEAARKFLDREGLNLDYLDQVANFILKNSSGAVMLGNAPNVDPWTGGASGVNEHSKSGGSSVNLSTEKREFSKAVFLTFDKLTVNEVLSKVKELRILSDLKELESMLSMVKDTAHYHSSVFTPAQFVLAFELLHVAPECRLPFLDFWRQLILHPSILEGLQDTYACPFVNLIIASSTESAIPIHVMLGVRILTNLISTPLGRKIARESIPQIMDFMRSIQLNETHKLLPLSLATLLLNLSSWLREINLSEDSSELLAFIFRMLNGTFDDETLYRLLVAVGELLDGHLMLINVAKKEGFNKLLANLKSNDERVTNTAKLLGNYFHGG